MSQAEVYAAFFVLSAPWWAPLVRTLLADVKRAGDEPEAVLTRLARPPTAARRIDANTRTPLDRPLAFRCVGQRVAARRRWEAGFGRRGL